MKIIVNPDPVATAILNTPGFVASMKNAFDLSKAIEENLRVVQSRTDATEMKEFIYQAMDWSNVLMLWDQLPKDLEIRVHQVDMRGLTVYDPGVIDAASHTMDTRDRVIDKTDFLVLHTANPRLDKHLEYLFAQNLINYGDQEWEILFDLTRATP